MMVRQRVFRSRVARRVLLMFVVSAVIPTLVIAGISLFTVTDHLGDFERDRLRRNAKGVGLAVLERLQFHATELHNLGLLAASGHLGFVGRTGAAFADGGRYRGIVLIGPGGRTQLMGNSVDISVSEEQRRHLDLAGAAIANPDGDSGPRTVMLIRTPSPAGANTVVAELEPGALFAAGSNKAGLPTDTDVCVYDARERPLYCSGTPTAHAALDGRGGERSGGARVTLWTDGPARRLTASWPLFLQSTFGVPSWTVTLSEPAEAVLQPIRRFRRTFPLAISLGVAMVFLMSSVQIRRVLHPIRRLREGTARLARGDFQEEVRIDTGDEFTDLAAAFNEMAARIARQIASLDARNRIDRAVLSKLDAKEIVATVLERAPRSLGAEGALVLVRRPAAPWIHWELSASGPGGRYSARITPPPNELELLGSAGGWIVDGNAGDMPAFLRVPSFAAHPIEAFVLEPIRVGGELTAAVGIAYGNGGGGVPDLGDRRTVRQLADQMAVALSNVQLVQDLEALNIGTLEALARAIDAKSRWTAGHATRVTSLAMELGRVIRLNEQDAAVLHRGSLLHDIGKIGVPAAILDKPGALTEEEERVMRSHPETGARILAPIAAYQPAIPLVLSHHERWDGTGYPHGLAREEIPFLARILAVADVWDALTSSRPYRAAFTATEAIEVIERGSGSHFDPNIVRAVLPYLTTLVEGRAAPAARRGDARHDASGGQFATNSQIAMTGPQGC